MADSPDHKVSSGGWMDGWMDGRACGSSSGPVPLVLVLAVTRSVTRFRPAPCSEPPICLWSAPCSGPCLPSSPGSKSATPCWAWWGAWQRSEFAACLRKPWDGPRPSSRVWSPKVSPVLLVLCLDAWSPWTGFSDCNRVFSSRPRQQVGSDWSGQSGEDVSHPEPVHRGGEFSRTCWRSGTERVFVELFCCFNFFRFNRRQSERSGSQCSRDQS